MKAQSDSQIVIDGSQGEGGGQTLRSSLSLSMLTGKPFTITNIRGQRKKPGLLRQHLTAVKAAARIACAEVSEVGIGSKQLRFAPSATVGGHYEFAVGTAGSAMLILQTILPSLCVAEQESELVLCGGTHNPFAPTFDFIERAFLPTIKRMGGRVSFQLDKPGFFPAGGGRLIARIKPAPKLTEINLLERGELKSRQAISMINQLPDNIGNRELKIARDRLGFAREELILSNALKADGPGNVFQILLEFEQITEVFTGFGEVGTPAETIARKTCDAVERYFKSDAPVGDYLADQLLLPLAMAGGGSFRCMALTQHFKTNAEIIERFLPIKIRTVREDRLAWRVTILK